ncbi:junctional cadherin 5-associated protein [Bombina bombina]|uniref:junctional cadherin 5-associated protein n=1 Tax=Bombina bombina TaxID=8345 RepID=UPI00235AB879|nr:junctional cadherin 5-associated protein [Bombina bombina]
MFSVEDLLVSHGYKVSKNALSSYQHRSEGYQPDVTNSRSGSSGTVNGYQSDPDILATQSSAKGILSDNERGCLNAKRQAFSAGYPRSHQCLEVCRASETGLSDRPQIERSHWTKTDKDVQYWRRKGQDFSVLLVPGNDGEAGDKLVSSIDEQGKKRSNVTDKTYKDQGVLVEKLENVWSTVSENWQPSLEKQCECEESNAAKKSKTSEKKMPNGNSEQLLHDFISYTPGDNALDCQNKLNPQPLPNSISPESLRTVQDENSFMKDDGRPSHNKYSLNVESNRHLVAKLKYSRPLKPPSYELHQQTWGAVDINENQDNQQTDEHSSSPRTQDLSQDSCSQDSGPEPPLYIPPPSYKSPPLFHPTSNQSFNKVPSVNDYRIKNKLVEKTSTSDKQNSIFPGNNIPYSKPAKQRHSKDCTRSVQYISFDDPRIKHIKVANDPEKRNHGKRPKDANDSRRIRYTSQESHFQFGERDSAFSNPKILQSKNGKRESIKHKQWLHITIPDQICCALHEPRDGSTASSLPENSEITHKLSLKKTQSDSACETVTKVKKYEPESYLPGRKNSKRKLKETIFCLVSIPVKSDSAPSDIGKNNSDFVEHLDRENILKHKNGFFCEQRLLSASSSDIELQTLTGSMNNKVGLLNQELCITEESKQANYLKSIEQRKHKELTYSGSWPGDQYKDQQTQTPPFYSGIQTNDLHNNLEKSQCKPVSEPTESRLPFENGPPNLFSMKGQMNLSPSSNSAFSRMNASKIEPRFDFSNEITEQREKDIVGKCEKNELEKESICNKKEAFGQFLLKPVNRRPWDAISELESLNKEFQDQENADCESEKNVAKEQIKDLPMDVPNTRTAIRREMISNDRHVREVQECPIFGSLGDKSRSESWCTEKLVSQKNTSAELPNSIKTKETSIMSNKSSNSEIQIKKTINKNPTACTNVDQNQSSAQPYVSKIKPNKNKLRADPDFYHFRNDKPCFNHMFLEVRKMNKVNQFQDKAIRKLSLSDRNHGLSVPDLSNYFMSTTHNAALNEQHNDLEIPENESLHERAARILGIDVANDCLVSTEHSETQSPENVIFTTGAQKEEKPREKINETFVSLKSSPETCSSAFHSTLDTERVLEKLKNFEQGQEQFFQSVSQHSEVNIAQSTDKKVRNTSKMIETIQGKLASTPPRTAVDRLARMKEVDSVSRMRRLSIKSTDSGDDLDDEKQLYKTQDIGTRKFSTGSVFKRVISLDESLLITPKGKEKMNLPSADSYDPARVERV